MVNPNHSLLPHMLSISDDPMARLTLLEQVQGKRDWLATVMADSPADKTALIALKTELDKGAYASYLDKGLHGKDVLRVHHIGKDTDIVEGFSSLGMIRGFRHAIENVATPLQDSAAKIGSALKYTAQDPARLMAGIYLFGDVQYIKAGKSFNNPKEALKSMSGIMATIQSLIFLNYAKDPSEHHLKEVGKALEKVAEQGLDPFDVSLWQAEHKQNDSVLGKVDQLLKRHPIEIGSFTQILGQIGLLISGGINLAETGEGKVDMGRSMASIVGWAMLMAKGKHVDEKTPWNENPLNRVSQEFTENPSHFSSSITTLASVIGLFSSNHDQLVAEASYLMGDATMFFIDRGGNKAEAATKVAAEFIHTSPILFSARQQTAFVHQLAGYLAERIVDERLQNAHNKHPDSDVMIQEEKTHITQEMVQNIFKELAGKDQRIDKVANTIARLSELFPEAQRDALEEALTHTITQLSGVCVDDAELRVGIKGQRDRFTTPRESPASAPSMGTVATILAELTFQLPSVNAAENATQLYNTVRAMTRQTPAQDAMFERAVMQHAAADVGVSPQIMQSFTQNAEKIR